MSETLNRLLRRLPRWLVWALGLLPLVWLMWQGAGGGLGVDPARRIEHFLGKTALWFLLGGLAITPLRRLTGISLLRQRRDIGLLAFLHTVLHLLAWLVLDMGLQLGQAARDLLLRPYLTIGLAAFLVMLPLALTSNDRAIRRLGRNWQRLHRLTYAAVLLAVVHYLWQMKVVTTEGWIWLAVAAGLLGMRLLWLRRRL